MSVSWRQKPPRERVFVDELCQEQEDEKKARSEQKKSEQQEARTKKRQGKK